MRARRGVGDPARDRTQAFEFERYLMAVNLTSR